jgi:7-carboxy-7-deazaguanine synthase
MTTYKINELFETIQGEGQYTGTASIFVRLQGCPVGCSWCDTKQTWDTLDTDKVDMSLIITKTDDTPTWGEVTAEQVLEIFKEQGYLAKHVVITGGEPCMYNLNPLCELLHEQGYQTQIETSGTFEVQAPEKNLGNRITKDQYEGGI